MTIDESTVNEINSAIEETVADTGNDAQEQATEATPPVPETSEDDPPAESPDAETETVSEGGQDDGSGQPAAETTTVTPPAISDHTLTMAVQAGIPLATARSFASEQALRDMVSVIQAKDESAEAAPPEPDPLDSLPTLDPENYDPEVIKMFDALVGVVRQQREAIKTFQGQQEQTARVSQEAASRDVEQWFDQQVAQLGDDFSEALGTGGYSALDRGSSQYAKRDAIANQMSVLLAGYRVLGQQAPPREQVFDTAARLVLADEYQKVHEKKLTSDLAKRSSQHIQRAGGQKATSKLSPDEETAALLDEKFFK